MKDAWPCSHSQSTNKPSHHSAHLLENSAYFIYLTVLKHRVDIKE